MRDTGRSVAGAAVIWIGLAAACDDATNPGAAANAGTIRVSAATIGPDADDDGYDVIVDGGATRGRRLGPTGLVSLDNLRLGSHTLLLGDVADNCTVSGPNPRVVEVSPNATVTADFAVTCAAKGTVQISNATTGADQDPDGYIIRLERGYSSISTPVPAGGSANIAVTAGSYVVSLLGVAANCTVTVQPGGPARQVEVASGATAVIAFAVTCAFVPLPQLAFVRGGQIYGVNVDGTAVVRLSDGPDDADPAWSPDGRRIAFARTVGRALWGDVIRDIYVMDADGSNVVRLTRIGHTGQPSWSPDGRRIAFAARCDDYIQGCIFVTSAAAQETNLVRLGLDNGFHDSPAWSPDGSKIAFTADYRAYDILFDLYVANADGSDVKMLIAGPFFAKDGLTFYFQPAWSPDGRRIAVVVCGWDRCYPNGSVAVMNADGSGLTTVAQAGGLARPTWSPNGSQLAFSSAPCWDCPASIYLVQADGSDRRLIIADGHSPSWRP